MTIASVNPATGATLKSFAEHGPDEIETAVATAAATFRSWRRVPFAERAVRMNAAAARLESEKRRYAEAMTLEMGKPIVFPGDALRVDKFQSVPRLYNIKARDWVLQVKVSGDQGSARLKRLWLSATTERPAPWKAAH